MSSGKRRMSHRKDNKLSLLRPLSWLVLNSLIIVMLLYFSILEKPPTQCELGTHTRLPDFDWYSGCNCFGFHKPRQCYKDSITGKYECWCSDEYGYKIGPGKSFTCSEKLTE